MYSIQCKFLSGKWWKDMDSYIEYYPQRKCQEIEFMEKEKIIKCDFLYQNEQKTSQQEFQKKSLVSIIYKLILRWLIM